MTRSSARSHRFSLVVVCLLTALLLLSGMGSAQTSNTSLSGVVKDPQDKVIPGATLTLTNIATNTVRTQKSNAQGVYSFDLLPPGDYRLQVEAAGFRKQVLENIHVLIAKMTGLDVQLQVGAADQVVTVSAESGQVLVDTQDASLGNNFVSEQITQLPLEARNVLSLLTLQPGVTKDGYVAGGRADQSNVTLDGVDINEAASNAIGGAQTAVAEFTVAHAEQGPVLRLNSEAIEEFRVATVNSGATGGRSSGAQIALATKSGTNTWHGAAFESNRNTKLTANDWFNNHDGVARPKLIRNTFGGAIGGPIKKDKAFFFYSYEGRIDASQTPVLAGLSGGSPVPTASLGQGILKFRTCGADCNTPGPVVSLSAADFNKIFPDINGINQAGLQTLASAAAKYPVNDNTIGDGMNTGGFRFNAAAPVHLHSHSAKLDFNLTSKQTIFVRGNVIYDKWGGIPAYPDTPAPDEWDHPMGIAVGHTWTISNNLINNFRYGYTRQAFTQGGDTNANNIRFRFVYYPTNGQFSIDRVTPVNNWVDDLNWVKGNHTLQFGVNITKTNNIRTSFANAYDNAVTNPSYYLTDLLRSPLSNYAQTVFGSPMYSGDGSDTENAMTALIGRFTQYTANYTYNNTLNLTPSGTPTNRNFAGQNYEGYVQDIWKARPSLTLTLGLRYGLARPIYETQGYETKPDVALGDYLNYRGLDATHGVNYTQPINVNLSGPANGASPMYNWDKTNFQPRVGVAWSPKFDSGVLAKIFGKENQSVIRGGFGINGDYFGQALATFFDNENTLGFGSSFTVGPNTYDVGCSPYQDPGSDYYGAAGTCPAGVNLGPLYTGLGQPIRGVLPAPPVQTSISFPQQQPGDNSLRIESSLDSNLTTPKSYSWSATFERQLPHGSMIQVNYLGRAGRHLLAQRDVMQPIDLVDPKSGMDWYTAGTMLAKQRAQGVATTAIAAIPYFENLFPGVSGNLGYDPTWSATQGVYQYIQDVGGDYTTTQSIYGIDGLSNIGPNAFYQPQYGALATWSSIGNSNFHALAVSYKIRTNALTADVNYTWSHSLDDSSGLQNGFGYNGEAFILNPFRQRDMYSNSDFDMRHQINVNTVWQLPFGHGRMFGGDVNKLANGFIGSWQLTSIFRWNTGTPVGFYNGTTGVFDDARWATNWEVQSNAVRTTDFGTCPTKPVDGTPKLFGCNTAYAFQHFRNPYPGETGERNVFRVPGYVSLDLGLGKTFHMNGISAKIPESHQLQVRWEVFNLTNTQKMGAFDASRSGFGIPLDPNLGSPPDNFSNFTAIQGTPRVMQVTLRYSF
ncbi:MAG: outer membrane beta-barrel protein [Terriglobales bacterium]